jgi:hypothetical protein
MIDQGGGGAASLNLNTEKYIAYCFHSVDGYSKMGSYTGNGDADGTFVYTGFRPAFILRKGSSFVKDWWMGDSKRSTYNTESASLYPNKTDAEYTGTGHELDWVSNGFKIRNTNSSFNTDGETYIYIAFAETPFKYSNAR